MAKSSNKNYGAADVQVFELTMDNDEDQDELNRRLRKPGEPSPSAPAKPVEAANKYDKHEKDPSRLKKKKK